MKDCTIAIVTHNVQQAARVSDGTGFFTIGGSGKPDELVQTDDAQRIFANPVEERSEACITGRFGWTGGTPAGAAGLCEA